MLTPLADRSVRASGKADPGSYTLTFRTSLRNIRGLRIEALTDETIKGNGPGLPENGNFVVTELEVTAAPLADEKALRKSNLHRAKQTLHRKVSRSNKSSMATKVINVVGLLRHAER